jgi:hypothetical protein
VYFLSHEILSTTRCFIEKYQIEDLKLLLGLEYTKGKLHNEENEPMKAEPHWGEALRIAEA